MANSAKTASIPPHDPEWKIVRLAGEWLKRLWWNGVDGWRRPGSPAHGGKRNRSAEEFSTENGSPSAKGID